MLLEDVDFVEEVGNVDDAAGADEVDAALSEDAGGCEDVSDWSRGVSCGVEETGLRKMWTSKVVPSLTMVWPALWPPCALEDYWLVGVNSKRPRERTYLQHS
jgi:hypothetical protein